MTAERPLQEQELGTCPPEPGPGASLQKVEDPDRELVSAALSEDSRAFEELVRRHQDSVYTRIFFMVRDHGLAEDLAQEAFLKAYLGLKNFRGESRFSTWLGRIAVNVTLHYFEKAGAQKRSAKVISIHAPQRGPEEGGQIEIEDRTHLPDEWAVRNERQAAILKAVGELDPEYRIALALRELYGYSYMEITEALQIPIGTVKSKIFRARQMLKEKLEGML